MLTLTITLFILSLLKLLAFVIAIVGRPITLESAFGRRNKEIIPKIKQRRVKAITSKREKSNIDIVKY